MKVCSERNGSDSQLIQQIYWSSVASKSTKPLANEDIWFASDSIC